jgi:hypothetical protein
VRIEELLDALGHSERRFGVLAESNTDQLTVIARDTDVAVGDLFLLPSRRGADRFYLFRTTHYANILAYQDIDLRQVAGNKVRFADSYFAEDASVERLIELRGMVLGYAEHDPAADTWSFHRPRRLPQHLSDVYRIEHDRPEVAAVLRTLMRRQLGEGDLYLGDLLAGENSLPGVPVYLPAYALSHHIGVFGRTGTGKSNLMMVLLRSVLDHNRAVAQGGRAAGPRASVLAIDPHDEFRYWHRATGGADGIHGIVHGYTAAERESLVAPFYYLSAKDLPEGDDPLAARVRLSRADIVPDDLISISEFSEAQIAFAGQFYAAHGERWVGRLLLGDTGAGGNNGGEVGAEFLPGTIAAVQRRVDFLRHGHGRLVTRYDPEMGQRYRYDSSLPDILCALEQGRVLIIDTTLMGEMEQFLLTTVVARVLFSLRKALRSADSPQSLGRELRLALMNDDEQGQVGMRALADELVRRLESGALPYLDPATGQIVPPDRLPYVNVVIEEAPSVLNPQRMKFGSVFRDISRQGRKFGIGLTVVSQQVTEIDPGVLTQINTELTMSLGNEAERRAAISTASADLHGFERELQVMGRGQVLLSASYKDIPLPVMVPRFERLDVSLTQQRDS